MKAYTLDSGTKVDAQALVSVYGKTEAIMRDFGKQISFMVKEN